MVTGNERYIIDQLNSMTINEARKAIASGKFGSPGRPDHAFALNWLAAKEAEERDSRDSRIESISRKALRNSTWANIIAISAIILSISAIALQWLQWLSKN